MDYLRDYLFDLDKLIAAYESGHPIPDKQLIVSCRKLLMELGRRFGLPPWNIIPKDNL